MPFVLDSDHMLYFEEALMTDFPTYPNGTCEVVESGFPMRCLCGWEYRKPPALVANHPFSGRLRWEVERTGLIEAPYRGPPPGVKKWFVYWPMWPGLAVNTAFYGFLAGVVLFAVGAVRGVVRRRTGLCPRCRYDRAGLAASAVCPECGAGAPGGAAQQ